jgi:hypothetical protein
MGERDSDCITSLKIRNKDAFDVSRRTHPFCQSCAILTCSLSMANQIELLTILMRSKKSAGIRRSSWKS